MGRQNEAAIGESGAWVDGSWIAITPEDLNGNVLDFLKQHCEIPSVCYHPSLGAIETCDTCIVECGGVLRRACSEPLRNGMRIATGTPAVLAAQHQALDRLLVNHELYCTVCDNNNGDCTLHNAVRMSGMREQSLPFTPKPYALDDSSPFYVYNPDQCIACGRCVEVCQDIEVNETLHIDWSLPRPRVVWDDGVQVADSSCVSCGQCVTVCPVNALMEKSMIGKAGLLTGMDKKTLRPLIDITKEVEPSFIPILALSDMEAALRPAQVEKTKTVCTYCGVGCSFEVWTKGRDILKVQPSPEAPANGISTCVKGKFGWDFISSPDRLKVPLVREGDHFRESTWSEALALIAERFNAIRQQHGPDAFGVIASSKCTNEESFLTQKLARQVIGTNNIDNCSRYCQSPATAGLWRTVGYGGDAGSISDIEGAELVIIVGSNTAESHPVLASRVKRAHKLHGQKLIVADLRRHEMAERADMFLHPNPGTDLFWLSAVSKYILDQGWQAESFLQERVQGLAEYRASLESFTLERAEAVTGIAKGDLIKVAEAIHEAESCCVLWAMGVTQHQGGSDTSTALSNLMLLSGNYGRPHTGCYPLRGHNNVQGTSDFGAMPNYLPGYQPVTDDAARKAFDEAWQCTVPPQPGLDNHQMIDAIHQGSLHALYIVGEEIAVVDANLGYVRDALERVDFLVVQDIFLSKTAQYADVVLPAAPSLEKEGTFTSTERRIQRLHKALPALGDALADWQILTRVAQSLGADWRYESPEDVMREAAGLCPMFAGVTYERLEGYASLQWPVAEDGTDSPYLYAERFNFPNGLARLYPLTWQEPLSVDETFDLHLNNGRLLEHFHEGALTYRSAGISTKVPSTFLEISPALAKARGLKTGDLVRLTSPFGALEVRVLPTDRVSHNELYLPMNDSGAAAVNLLTSSLTDRSTDTPAFKELPVRLEKLADGGGRSPLPLQNPRFATRRPRIGVGVDEKWQRADYRFPGDAMRGESADG